MVVYLYSCVLVTDVRKVNTLGGSIIVQLVSDSSNLLFLPKLNCLEWVAIILEWILTELSGGRFMGSNPMFIYALKEIILKIVYIDV